MNLRPLGYEPSGFVQHSPAPRGSVPYRLAAGGMFRQAVSTHAKAVRLQQASLPLAGAPGQRGDQLREPGWAADCGAYSDNDGETAAGHGAQRPGGLAQTPTTVVHLSRRTAASSYGDQGHGCRPASDSGAKS